MHHYYIFLLAGLLVVPWLQSGVMASQHAKEPGKCCFEFYGKIIPFSKIESYEETRSDCSRAGVVITTKRSLHICVKPEQEWVKKAMDRVIQRNL